MDFIILNSSDPVGYATLRTGPSFFSSVGMRFVSSRQVKSFHYKLMTSCAKMLLSYSSIPWIVGRERPVPEKLKVKKSQLFFFYLVTSCVFALPIDSAN
jgi:hypothetical protein